MSTPENTKAPAPSASAQEPTPDQTMKEPMTDREHLRQAIVTLRRNAWLATQKAMELERTYSQKYGMTRSQKAKVAAELEAIRREAFGRAMERAYPGVPVDLMPVTTLLEIDRAEFERRARARRAATERRG